MAKRSSKQSELTPAVGYLRKSTKGKLPDGRERQEKSINQQKNGDKEAGEESLVFGGVLPSSFSSHSIVQLISSVNRHR